MKVVKVVVSNEAPPYKDVVWAKTVDGGFAFYMRAAAGWQPLKMMDDQDTASLLDDLKATIIQGVKVNNTKLTPSARGVVTINIAEGTAVGNIKVNNTDVPVKGLAGVGTFANKPANAVAGTQYFCTDKQTTEGATNGIVIYYNGTDWVDALGRAIESEGK